MSDSILTQAQVADCHTAVDNTAAKTNAPAPQGVEILEQLKVARAAAQDNDYTCGQIEASSGDTYHTAYLAKGTLENLVGALQAQLPSAREAAKKAAEQAKEAHRLLTVIIELKTKVTAEAEKQASDTIDRKFADLVAAQVTKLYAEAATVWTETQDAAKRAADHLAKIENQVADAEKFLASYWQGFYNGEVAAHARTQAALVAEQGAHKLTANALTEEKKRAEKLDADLKGTLKHVNELRTEKDGAKATAEKKEKELNERVAELEAENARLKKNGGNSGNQIAVTPAAPAPQQGGRLTDNDDSPPSSTPLAPKVVSAPKSGKEPKPAAPESKSSGRLTD